jgi:hypothetical protein
VDFELLQGVIPKGAPEPEALAVAASLSCSTRIHTASKWRGSTGVDRGRLSHELAKSVSSGWIVKDGGMASAGSGSGVIYSAKDSAAFG